ncbi:MAG: HAD family hydrolase [Treponema sp.]|nr:HAD family hydrolase [Treponema sp.]
MNTKLDIAAFVPTKEFFIGIDSDGTAFDAMNTKHIKSMCPTALEIWNIEKYKTEFEKIWYKYNLYSGNRGANRFMSILSALDQLNRISDTTIDTFPLRAFVKNNETLSNETLNSWMEKNPSPLLEKVLNWSKKSDELLMEYTQGQLPFHHVEESLKIMAEKADIMVVSSAAGISLDKDWSFSGITKYVSLLAGQETGSKKAQLSLAVTGKYSPQKVLVIGDAPVDLEAARSVNALFFPVMPGQEEESWITLKEEALPKFFDGKFHGEYENSLIIKFLDFLVEIQE